MPDGNNSSDAFFINLLSHADPSRREEIIKDLIRAAKETREMGPVRAVLEIKARELDMARAELKGSPIDESGEWLTASQIYNTFDFNVPRDVVQATLDNNRGAFGPRLEEGRTVYWIAHNTIPILERKASSPFKYRPAMATIAEVKTTIKELRKTFGDLETICDTPTKAASIQPASPPTNLTSTPASPDSPPTQNYTLPEGKKIQGVWMTGQEIMAAGSTYCARTYVGYVLKRNPDLFHTRTRKGMGSPSEGFVTQENFERLGLEEFPKAFIEAQGLRVEELDASGNSSLPVQNSIATPSEVRDGEKIKGVWLSYEQVLAAGSKYKSGTGYLSSIAHRNEKLFPGRSVPNHEGGRHKEVFVTEFNYKRLGLPEFPQTFIEKSGLKLEEIIDPREEPKLQIKIGSSKPRAHESGVYGIWMTAKDIIAAGSELSTSTYIATLFRKNEGEFKPTRTDDQGAPYRGLITMENFRRVGLKEFPVNFAKQHNLLTLEEQVNIPPVIIKPKPLPAPTSQLPPVHQEPAVVKPTSNYIPPVDKGPEARFDVNGQAYTLYPNVKYDEPFLTKLLSRVHSGVFNDFSIKKFIATRKNGDNEVPGNEVITLLQQVNGLIVLGSSSTAKKLENELGCSYSEIKEAFVLGQGFERYQHRVEGLVDTPYVLVSELPALKKDMAAFLAQRRGAPRNPAAELVDKNTITPQIDLKTAVKSIQQGIGWRKFEDTPAPRTNLPPTNYPARRPYVKSGDRTQQRDAPVQPTFNPALVPFIQTWHRNFEEAGIMPRGDAYHSLLRLGILKLTSKEDIIASHSKFMGLMEGYEFANLKDVCARTGYDWREVTARTFAELKSRRLIKDLAKEVGLSNGKNFYVIQRGKLPEIAGYIENTMRTLKS